MPLVAVHLRHHGLHDQTVGRDGALPKDGLIGHDGHVDGHCNAYAGAGWSAARLKAVSGADRGVDAQVDHAVRAAGIGVLLGVVELDLVSVHVDVVGLAIAQAIDAAT